MESPTPAKEDTFSAPRAGQIAPGFALSNQYGELIESRLLGEQAYFLVFYPYAFSAVCGSELEELEKVRQEFAGRRIRIMAVSVDHKFTLRTYADQAHFGFDLLADFWPHGAVANSYGAFNYESGAATRHTFLIAEGRVVDSFSSPIHLARNIARYREAMDLLT